MIDCSLSVGSEGGGVVVGVGEEDESLFMRKVSKT